MLRILYSMMILLGCTIIQVDGNIELVKMSISKAQKYQCGSQSCNSFVSMTVSNLRHCQMACTANSKCSASDFHQSTKQCQLYDSKIKSNGTFIADPNMITMTVTVDGRNRTDDNARVFVKLHNISANATWSKNGTTVITGLSTWPFGLAIDQQIGTVFVADFFNNSIVSWTPGQQGIREVLKNLWCPTNVLIDKDNNSLIIADRANERVSRFSLQNNNTQIERIIDNISCTGLAIDDEGTLYVTVTDFQNISEVRRYQKGNTTGEIVAGGNGQGSRLDQLDGPRYVTVDSEGAVYVSDWNNHRVVRWNRGATQGIIVAGFGGFGSSNTQLHYPHGIFVDANINLYVVDQGNHRVVRYRKNETTADIIADQLNQPLALAFDNASNLYVSDLSALVVRFNITH